MAKWYYINKFGDKKSVAGIVEMQHRVKNGMIKPETIVEDAEGKTMLAKDIKGLIFPKKASPKPPLETKELKKHEIDYYYYDEKGELIGVTFEQLKGLVKDGRITPETSVVIAKNGQLVRAKQVDGLFAEKIRPTLTPEPPVQTTENWYYINQFGTTIGPLDMEALKERVEDGRITPETILKTLRRCPLPASKVEGLIFPKKESPEPQSQTKEILKKHEIAYYHNNKGEKINVVGRLNWAVWDGLITPETIVETTKGQIGQAKMIEGLTFPEKVQSTILLREKEKKKPQMREALGGIVLVAVFGFLFILAMSMQTEPNPIMAFFFVVCVLWMVAWIVRGA